MAGHSKWANIKHRKAGQDKKRSKIFTKLNREITVAAREGGGDPDGNPRLRLAIEKAKRCEMPKDTIEKAILKATGGLDDLQLVFIRYEGYGPSGTAVMVDCLTDNRNRTVAEVRHAFSKCGGNLGTSGSVAYMFKQRGQIIASATPDQEDALMEKLIEAGAEDLVFEDATCYVLTQPEDFEAVNASLASDDILDAEITWIPDNKTQLSQDDETKVIRMLDMLEDLDDVQQVYHNAELSDDHSGD